MIKIIIKILLVQNNLDSIKEVIEEQSESDLNNNNYNRVQTNKDNNKLKFHQKKYVKKELTKN